MAERIVGRSCPRESLVAKPHRSARKMIDILLLRFASTRTILQLYISVFVFRIGHGKLKTMLINDLDALKIFV